MAKRKFGEFFSIFEKFPKKWKFLNKNHKNKIEPNHPTTHSMVSLSHWDQSLP
jgi:hypothetical protein